MDERTPESKWTRDEITDIIESIPSNFPTVYCWDYEVNRKLEQWNAQTTPDWSIDVEVTRIAIPMSGSRSTGRSTGSG